MTQEQPSGPEHSEVEPPWDGKVLALNAALADSGVPYAFGGAIALNYHREPRSTLDIDINVFVEPVGRADVLAALSGLYDVDQAKVGEELERDGQSRSLWGTTFIGLFFTDTDFHRSMAERVGYIRSWLTRFLGESDPKLSRMISRLT